jgi:hypothetical protein
MITVYDVMTRNALRVRGWRVCDTQRCPLTFDFATHSVSRFKGQRTPHSVTLEQRDSFARFVFSQPSINPFDLSYPLLYHSNAHST